jgi:hypothetical protein
MAVISMLFLSGEVTQGWLRCKEKAGGIIGSEVR